MNDTSFQRLKDAKESKTSANLMGTHTYDILANPIYCESFQYFSCAIKDREKYIVDDDENEDNDMAQSNMIRVALGLGYLFNKYDF